jgi:SAM-dependent methyltransferase
MQRRVQAQVFGEIADLYDRVRKPYPAELFDDVLDYSGDVARALEIGAGTGRATAEFAARGVEVTAVEPDGNMAAILARRAPGVRIFPGTFEEFRPSARFDLVFSAEAWHWTEPSTRWARTASALADGGTFALLWNNERLADPALQKAFVDVFASLAPSVTIRDLSVTPERVWSQWPGDEVAAADGFGDLTSRHYLRLVDAPASDFIGLTETRSQFRMLPVEVRKRILDRLAELFGDRVQMAVDTTLLLATRRSTAPGASGPENAEPLPAGEVWWADLETRAPVVLLGGGREIRVVAPATEAQKRGYLLLTGAEAADAGTRARLLAETDAAVSGAEVVIPGLGVVRVAFPQAGRIFCTWETELTGGDLIERITVLPPETRHQLDTVMRLADPQP